MCTKPGRGHVLHFTIPMHITMCHSKLLGEEMKKIQDRKAGKKEGAWPGLIPVHIQCYCRYTNSKKQKQYNIIWGIINYAGSLQTY